MLPALDLAGWSHISGLANDTCRTACMFERCGVQVHGGAGVCDDLPLARMWSGARTLRLADGPDDVHLVSIAKLELAKLSKL